MPPGLHTFLYGGRKALLLLHAASAVLLLGSATHLAAVAWRRLRGGRSGGALERRWGRVQALAFGAVYALGALLYPTYRVHVRGLYLDRHYPWVANLFDVKENLATMALPLSLGVALLAGRLTDEPDDRAAVRAWCSMALFVAAVVWFNTLSGWLIVSYRSV
ncbi:MAG: hypothetical protein HY909_26290 [Deltaproteobacteria bacterium]|nr:hypothetical protein [Deltaproteobacteria bacterium]